MITIDANANAIQDGKNLGHLIDAIQNAPLLRADIKAAFDLWFIVQYTSVRDVTQAKAREKDKALSDQAALAEADKAFAIEALQAKHADELAALAEAAVEKDAP